MAITPKITKETIVVAEKLGKIMRTRDMTSVELADRIGLSQQTVSGIMNKTRNVTAETLVELSLALDVSTDYLLGLSVAENISELEDLISEKDQLTRRVLTVYNEASKEVSDEARSARLEEAAKLEEEIHRLKIRIERSRRGLLRLPTIPDDGSVVYKPTPEVSADVAVLVRDGSGKLPPGTILYVQRNATDGHVFVSSDITLTKERRGRVIGAVKHALIPDSALGAYV